jgi:hypothetical protein
MLGIYSRKSTLAREKLLKSGHVLAMTEYEIRYNLGTPRKARFSVSAGEDIYTKLFDLLGNDTTSKCQTSTYIYQLCARKPAPCTPIAD